MLWLLGSIALAQWSYPLAIVAVVVVCATMVLPVWGRRFDALAMGDETALTLSVRPERFRVYLLVVNDARNWTTSVG